MVRRLIEGGIDGKLPIKIEPKDEQKVDASTAKQIKKQQVEAQNEEEEEEEEEPIRPCHILLFCRCFQQEYVYCGTILLVVCFNQLVV